MKIHRRSPLRKVAITLAMLALLVFQGMGSASYADDKIPCNVDLGFIPFTSTSASFQNGFGGTGIVFGVTVSPWNDWSSAVDVGFFSQTLDSVSYVAYRRYISGSIQYAQPNFGVDTTIRHSGTFIEAGPALYNLTTVNTLSNIQTTFSGFGVTVLLGLDYPIYKQIFFSPRFGYLNSVGGITSFSGYYLEVMLGLPFSF